MGKKLGNIIFDKPFYGEWVITSLNVRIGSRVENEHTFTLSSLILMHAHSNNACM